MNDKSYLANFSNGRYQNDCFCNTGVHILANCPAFRNYIMNLENNKIKNKPATRILKEIFSEMKTNAAHSFITDTFELKKELLHLDDGQQHDVFQFIEDLKRIFANAQRLVLALKKMRNNLHVLLHHG